MTDRTPAQLADDAAEAIRALNHATLSRGDGWQFPSDAYDVVGGLDRMANGLQQTLEQTSRLLFDLHADGHVRSDHGDAVTSDEVLAARSALRRAREHSAALSTALGDAHSALSPLSWKE